MTLPTPFRLLPLALLLGTGTLASGCRTDSPQDSSSDAATGSGALAQAAAHFDTDRPWSAAALMRAYAQSHTLSPEARLLAARAEAGSGEWERVRALLENTDGLDTLGGGRGLYLLARAQDDAGDFDAARTTYDAFLGTADSPERDIEQAAARLRRSLLSAPQDSAALAETTDLSPGWRAVLEAEALARAGNAAGVEQIAARARLGGGAQTRRLWAARIEAARRANDLPAARALADRARSEARSDEARAGFSLTSARLADAAGDRSEARTLVRSAITVAPASAAAREAVTWLRRGEIGRPEAADWLALARSDRALGLNADAADAFGEWLDSDAGTPAQQASVRFDAADALFDAQRYDKVEAMLAPIRTQTKARDLWAGTLGRMGRTEEAAAVYLDLAQADPAPNLYFAADVLQQGGDLAVALPLYRRVETEHAGTRWAGLATMRRAGQSFLDGDYAQAARLWDGYRSAQPDGPHALRARYWAGRALAEAGDTQAAEARFRGVLSQQRDSYYALLASQALGASFWPIPMRASPAASPQAEARVAQALHAVDVLREAGFADIAEAELDRVGARLGEGQAERYAFAEALIERGYGRRALLVGQSLGGGTNERRMRILYPFAFRRMITAEAQAQGVDPFAAAALIRQESQFEARATSHVGARGLMQLMPATARTLAQEIGIESLDPARLYLPETNVHLGTRYVGQQVAAYGGALPAVFGAYNAGPHQVEAWKSFPEWGRDALFTERIPFRETRDYVKILTRNRAIYEGLYGAR